MTAVEELALPEKTWIKDCADPKEDLGKTDIQAVLSERGERYGAFSEHARITQNIKDAMRDSPNWGKLPPYQKEALEMVAHKAGRLLNGDFMYEDNFIDMVGYAQLALEDTQAANAKVAKFQ